MAAKAQIFGDKEILKKILKTKNPRNHKEYGRQVSNFDKKTWEFYARNICYIGVMAKILDERNVNVRKSLIDNGYNIIYVEASPFDKIWGIGLDQTDNRCYNINEWKGTNWLGFVITKACRDYLDDNYFSIDLDFDWDKFASETLTEVI